VDLLNSDLSADGSFSLELSSASPEIFALLPNGGFVIGGVLMRNLRAMAASVTSGSELRVPVLDARRGEAFVAAYSADGSERLAPCALPVDQVRGLLETLGEPYVLVGGFSRNVGAAANRLQGREYDQPSARWVGVVASRLDPGQHPAEPIYVRGAGATLPNLPPSPISTSPPGSG
jgi:hypothetical protein